MCNYVSVNYGSVNYGRVKYGSVKYGCVNYGIVKYGSVKYGSVYSLLMHVKYSVTLYMRLFNNKALIKINYTQICHLCL